MKVPLSWLKEYVNINIASEELAERLDKAGIRVENIEKKETRVSNIVSGKIVEFKKHPNADKLNMARVDTGGETLEVITAATNLRVGDIVPLAKVGAILADGTNIKETNLRGIKSYGMMCSVREIGLDLKNLPQEEIEGVMRLSRDVPLGLPVKEIFGLDEVVINFEVPANRPDCLSVLGIAVEAANQLNSKVAFPSVEYNGAAGECKSIIDVKIEDLNACPRYIARIIKDTKIDDSPWWMRKRLLLAGIRPVNNIVDITNYVMLELGNPLHAFDCDKINGGQIIVRFAKDGEKLLTIDGEERVLEASSLVISDKRGPVALAGLMGGKETEITNNTKNILLEAALFEPACIRRTSLKLGLRSESSRRFEKGLDWHQVEMASLRATHFLSKAGSVLSGRVERGVSSPVPKEVLLRPERVLKILGKVIDRDEIKDKLRGLNFKIKEEKGDFMVEVPSVRKDIEQEIDLIEEVARLIHYDSIPEALPKGEILPGRLNPEAEFEKEICSIMSGLGLVEAITFSMVDAVLYESMGLKHDSLIGIINPIIRDQDFLRDSLLPSLVILACNNRKVKNENISVFEVGNVYMREGEEFKEIKKLGIALYGSYLEKNAGFYTLKGIMDVLFDQLGIKVKYQNHNYENSVMHPGMSCLIKNENDIIGYFGVFHPVLQEKFGLENNLVLGELDLVKIKKLGRDKKYVSVSKFPEVARDIAIVIKKEITSFQIEEIIKSAAGEVLIQLHCFDVYEGKQIEEGHKSLAYSMIFQSSAETLTEEQINNVMSNILKALEEKLGAKVRGK